MNVTAEGRLSMPVALDVLRDTIISPISMRSLIINESTTKSVRAFSEV